MKVLPYLSRAARTAISDSISTSSSMRAGISGRFLICSLVLMIWTPLPS